MAGIANSIKKSITDFKLGDTEFSMLHACMAIDGTAKKTYPTIKSVGARFKKLLRENHQILGPLGVPGIDLVNTKWPVEIKDHHGKNIIPDIADIIYSIHRCTHGHGNELPQGFELTRESGLLPYVTTDIETGIVKLSDCVIFGLLAIAVTAPANSDLSVHDNFYLSFRDRQYRINEWWGRQQEFINDVSQAPIPLVTMDFAHMMKITKN